MSERKVVVMRPRNLDHDDRVTPEVREGRLILVKKVIEHLSNHQPAEVEKVRANAN
jgi:hypothetical protein